MIDWSAVAPTLRTLFSEIALATAVNPAFLAQWSSGGREYVHPGVQQSLILRVTRTADVDVARCETYDAGPPATFTESIGGIREFTLEVRVESHDHREEYESWAWSMAERLRTSLLFQRSMSTLLAAGIGLVSLGPARDVSFKFNKRTIHAAMFEVTLNAAFNLADTVQLDWFEHVALTSRLEDPAGITLDSPPNVTDFVVTPEG